MINEEEDANQSYVNIMYKKELHSHKYISKAMKHAEAMRVLNPSTDQTTSKLTQAFPSLAFHDITHLKLNRKSYEKLNCIKDRESSLFKGLQLNKGS